jgi:hypothetical protein
MLPELQDECDSQPNALNKEFSSADTVLDLAGTVELLARHSLLIGPAAFREAAATVDAELLR